MTAERVEREPHHLVLVHQAAAASIAAASTGSSGLQRCGQSAKSTLADRFSGFKSRNRQRAGGEPQRRPSRARRVEGRCASREREAGRPPTPKHEPGDADRAGQGRWRRRCWSETGARRRAPRAAASRAGVARLAIPRRDGSVGRGDAIRASRSGEERGTAREREGGETGAAERAARRGETRTGPLERYLSETGT